MISVRRQPFRDKSNTKTKGNSAVPSKKPRIPNSKKSEHKQLRSRKVNNYKELSFGESSTPKQAQSIRVPIYLQKPAAERRPKKKDPFEFQETTPQKPFHEDGSESDSTIYDKSMKDILQDIRNREKRKETRAKKKVKVQSKGNVRQTLSVHIPKPNSNSPSVAQSKSNKKQPLSVRVPDPIPSSPSISVEPPVLVLSTSTPVQQTNSVINVVSNVQVVPPHRTPSPFSEVNGSSSPIWDYEFKDDDTQPWRGDHLNLRRNPHWLALKESSLPNYNQEMILEPELIEKFVPPKPAAKEKPLLQTKITSFGESGHKVIEISNASSLFDDHSFSPLKDDNKRLPFSPLNTEGISAKRQLDEDSCFGFDINDKENVSPVRRSSQKLPMRVSPRDVKRVYKAAVEKLTEDIHEDAVVDVSIPEENNESVHLFEDLIADTPIKHTYAVKRRKKLFVSAKDDEDKPKKKRKDLRTPAEEEEYNKWAANFNAMCEEVEQHSFEIV